MIVTDLQYSMESRLITKLDLMIDRCTRSKAKKDAVLINEGGEGEGKTNSSIAEAYYIKFRTGREIHLFLRLEPMIEFAQKNEGKIIIWDEPGLDSLSTDSLNTLNKDLIRLLMAVRIKRHFFIFNLTKFYKFNEYVVVDRALGLVHMYSRKEVEPGRFLYIRKKKLELLYNGYRQSKKRLYKKYHSIRGTMPEVMDAHFNKMGLWVNNVQNATLADYEAEKNKSIETIGKKENKSNKDKIKLRELRYKLSQIKPPINTKEELANQLGIDARILRSWQNKPKNDEKDTETLEKDGFEAEEDSII